MQGAAEQDAQDVHECLSVDDEREAATHAALTRLKYRLAATDTQ
jgi:hypothetical protein